MQRSRLRRSFTAWLILLVISAVVGACATEPAVRAGRSYQLTIMHTNDHHGNFLPNTYGEYGLAAQKSLVDRLRGDVAASGGYALLLSAGDINSGVPESSLQQAEPDFKGMRMLGYDAMALGNHEFDVPPRVLRQQAEWAGFPFLAANVFDKKTERHLFGDYITFDFDGLKVIVFGLLTEDTLRVGNLQHMHGMEIRPAVETAARIVPGLREKADLLIALTHMGYYPEGNHGVNTPGDVTLARKVPGIDVIVGGHTHDPLKQPVAVGRTLIVQAGEWGKYLGQLDLSYHRGELRLVAYRLIPVNIKEKVERDGKIERVSVEAEIPQDSSAAALLKPFIESGQKELGRMVGRVDGVLVGDRKTVRLQETNLGHLINRAVMEKTGADLAVMNSGGIRDDIEAGEVTYKEVLTVLPFGNTVCTVRLTGAELSDYLSAVLSLPADTGGFAQVAGISAQVQDGALTQLKINGRALAEEGVYTVGINSYIAMGGDGYPVLKAHPTFYDTGYVAADVLSTYLGKHSPLKIADYAPRNKIIRK